MKNLKLAFLFVIVLFANSCTKKNNFPKKEIAYYQFNELDIQRNSVYTQNQIIVFENEIGKQRKYKVREIDSDFKELYGVGMGFFSAYASSYFYYDRKEIIIDSYEDSAVRTLSFDFVKSPIDRQGAKDNIFTMYPSQMNSSFTWPYFNGYNSDGTYKGDLQIDYSFPKSTLTCFGTSYKNVLTIKSSGYVSSTQDPNEINTIYFDEFTGVIGFDDIKNLHWRLKK